MQGPEQQADTAILSDPAAGRNNNENGASAGHGMRLVKAADGGLKGTSAP
jgi:hypothetical protein